MNFKAKSVVAAALLAVSGYSMAVPIGGIDIPAATGGGTTLSGEIFENVVTAPGDVLTGYGKIDAINGVAVASLFGGELTYSFGGYNVSSISATGITFTGGYINFYLDGGKDFNPYASASVAADRAAATNGTLFLTLAGHELNALGTTFQGAGAVLGANLFGAGFGYADVDFTGTANGNTAGAGALANSFFDTNNVNAGFGPLADFSVASSFTSNAVPHGTGLHGTAALSGTVAAIPEPETYALLLAGMGVVAFVARRRRQG